MTRHRIPAPARRLFALLLTIACLIMPLSGCRIPQSPAASPIGVGAPPEEPTGQNTPELLSPTPEVSPPPPKMPPYRLCYELDPDTGFIETIRADLTGDGQKTEVGIAPDDIDSPDCGGFYAVFTIDGVSHSVLIEKENLHFLFGKAADLDGDGADELVFLLDPHGQGGYGQGLVTILKWSDGEMIYLPVPNFPYSHDNNGGYGFEVAGTLLDNYKADISVPDTGFATIFELDKEPVSELVSKAYDEDGHVAELFAGHELRSDTVCYAEIVSVDGHPALLIMQYICAYFHISGVGFLVSTLTWDENGFRVIRQNVMPMDFYGKYDFVAYQ